MIKEYQAEVIAAALLFEKYKGVHPSEAKRDGPEQMGYFDPEQTIYYYFHGMG